MPEPEIEIVLDSRGKPRVQTINTDPSQTIQSDSHLADIQNIMKNFGQRGLEQLDETDMMFMDVSEFTDFHDVMIQSRFAEVEFMKLPSKVREIFDHDVAVWLDTAHDKEKRDALVAAGYLKAPKDPEIEVVGTPPPEIEPPPAGPESPAAE